MDNLDEFDDEITRLEVSDASDESEFQLVSDADPLAQLPEDESSEKGRPRYPVLGDYLLMRKIGSGGMGRVFQARHRTMDRIVAIKMLPPNTMNSPEAVRRFRREVKAAAKLFHPNIVTAFDYREQDGIHYLAMEYVEGRPLSQLVNDHGPFTIEKTIDCAIQTAKGLDYAHSRGVIHRDIKPGNLILTFDGSIKVLDMGTARFPGEGGNETNLTQSGVIMGTVNYMSPEQARDARLVDARGDIYSLGCTIFFLATGAPPFQAENLMQTLMAHSRQPMPFIRDFRTDTPSWLDSLLHDMTAKQPDDRIPSMEEVVRRLQDASEPMERVAALRSPVQTHVASTTKPLGI